MTDPTPFIVGTLLVILVAYLLRDISKVDLTAPNPETQRPAPVDPCDLSDAWRPIGPLAPWESTRER